MRDQRQVTVPVARRRARALVFASFVAFSANSCRSSTSQIYAFEPVQSRSASGLDVSIVTRGRSVALDSAGVLIDRSASPYWIGVYVRGEGTGQISAAKLNLIGSNSRRAISPILTPPLPLSDSAPASASDTATRVFESTSVDLPFEEYSVSVILEREGSVGPSDTVRMRLKNRFRERQVSIAEWFRGL
jgi:hypothetical protein